MNRLRLLLVAGLVFVATLLVSVGLARAHDFRSGNTITVSANKTIDNSLYSAGRKIDIAGTVKGDVFCAGQTVTISGNVEGDVICAAQTITIAGIVTGDVRLAAQTVTLAGSVTNNATITGQDMTLSSDAEIGGDLSYIGQSANLNGSVGRDVAGGLEDLTLAGNVGRDVTATVKTLTLEGSAKISGTVNYTSSTKAVVESGASFANLNRTEPSKSGEHEGAGFSVASFVYTLLAALFGSLVLILLVPHFFRRTSQEAASQPGWTVLTGLVASIAIPIIVILVMVTVIGMPLGLLLMVLTCTLFALSLPVSAFYLGRLVFSRLSGNVIWIMLLGTALLVILLRIPYLNFFVWLAALWFGLGSILRFFKANWTRPHYQLEPVAPAAIPAKVSKFKRK